jgi:hypothetical protein
MKKEQRTFLFAALRFAEALGPKPSLTVGLLLTAYFVVLPSGFGAL